MLCVDCSSNNICNNKLMTADNKWEMHSGDSHLLHQAHFSAPYSWKECRNVKVPIIIRSVWGDVVLYLTLTCYEKNGHLCLHCVLKIIINLETPMPLNSLCWITKTEGVLFVANFDNRNCELSMWLCGFSMVTRSQCKNNKHSCILNNQNTGYNTEWD